MIFVILSTLSLVNHSISDHGGRRFTPKNL